MRALVLGGLGAVGGVVVDVLREWGHDVTPAGRRAPQGGLAVDLRVGDGLTRLAEAARDHDVVVNASGVEDPRIATALDGAVLVDISATARYLESLAGVAVDADAGVVLGAGLAPGLTTVLVAGLDPASGDEIDVAIVLGSGEKHGTAAVEWTAGLLGTPLHDPGEDRTIVNLRDRCTLTDISGRRRVFLRADFPDHLLVGVPRGALVRSQLAFSSPVATAALAVASYAPASAEPSAVPRAWGPMSGVSSRSTGQPAAGSARGAGGSRAPRAS